MSDRVLPQADFPVEELTVVFLFEGPNAAGMEREAKQRLANEHLQYTIGLVRDGHLVHAGAIVDEAREHNITGLGFSRKPPEEVARLVAEDPGVKGGLETFRVAGYRFPKGGLQFAREQDSVRKA